MQENIALVMFCSIFLSKRMLSRKAARKQAVRNGFSVGKKNIIGVYERAVKFALEIRNIPMRLFILDVSVCSVCGNGLSDVAVE